VGDVTGDGIPDLLAGAPDADGPPELRNNAGEAYVIQGGAGLNPEVGPEKRIDLFNAAGATLTIYGAFPGDRFGSTVAAGNYNTAENIDNIPDVIVGAPGSNARAGSVSIFFGGANLLAFPKLDVFLGQDSLRIVGTNNEDELGWAIATADVNNNQGGDLILGAPFANAPAPSGSRNQAGVVYILPSTTVSNQPPTVTVTAPNGGETLLVGQAFDITWTASDPNGDATIQKFDVQLSTNGGTNFNLTIAPNVAGTARKFTWTVPIGFNTTQGRVRVIATDSGGATAQDDSNANFTIAPAAVVATLTNPNGGALRFGQQINITWTVPIEFAATVKGFDLSLSTDSGQTFDIFTIRSNPAEPALDGAIRTFPWTVPNVCTTKARIAVITTTVSNQTSSDSSDNDIVISDRGPTIDTTQMFINDNFQLFLLTAPPAGGTEVLFIEGTLVEVSSDAAGTQFEKFSKPFGKIKKGGAKYLSKGTINGQDLGVFFPNGQTRVIRITRPGCGLTVLRVTRNGNQLSLAASQDIEMVIERKVWP
jgi:hypothetical protein